MEHEPGEGKGGRDSGATSLSCILGKEVKVLLRKGKWPGEHRSVSMRHGESGAWWFPRMMGGILYYRG